MHIVFAWPLSNHRKPKCNFVSLFIQRWMQGTRKRFENYFCHFLPFLQDETGRKLGNQSRHFISLSIFFSSLHPAENVYVYRMFPLLSPHTYGMCKWSQEYKIEPRKHLVPCWWKVGKKVAKIPCICLYFYGKYKDISHPADLLRFFVSSCWPMRDHIRRSPGIPTQLWHLPQVVPRVVHSQVPCTAQLLTLHQHRANNQYRTANQI